MENACQGQPELSASAWKKGGGGGGGANCVDISPGLKLRGHSTFRKKGNTLLVNKVATPWYKVK